MNIENYTDREWEELRKMGGDKEPDVDKAWNKVLFRINNSGETDIKIPAKIVSLRTNLMKIAAAAIVILGLGIAGLYITRKDILSKRITVTTDINQKNLEVTLPDGSTVILNRETVLSYRAGFGKSDREVALTGEAFFEIEPDQDNPFIINAGKAEVKVVGTSFNVITSNPDSAVEVFVKSGQVMLSDNSGTKTLLLDPGYVGKIDSKISDKSINNDPNYMAWNTGLLIYDGQTLDIVFRDLKRVYNLDIVADDPSILDEIWTAPINNQEQETIIRLICYSFNLGYKKDGNVYHLSKK
jgi:ferric-dicitrate binding protein FerR (iron transport regulator)